MDINKIVLFNVCESVQTNNYLVFEGFAHCLILFCILFNIITLSFEVL